MIFNILCFNYNTGPKNERPNLTDLLVKIALGTALAILVMSLSSCKKLVDVPEPVNSVTTAEAYGTAQSATSAVTAIYDYMLSGPYGATAFANGATTFYAGLSADEFNYFNSSGSDQAQLQTNNIQVTISSLDQLFWQPGFYSIYMANAAVESLNASTSLPSDVRSHLLGEAKFLRAFSNFYLVNLFGNIPQVTTTAWAQTNLLAKAPASAIYAQMEDDLHSAQTLLPTDYSSYSSQRVRANQFAATALLARVYLYEKKWKGADSAATAVITQAGMYQLRTDLNTVFLANSTESILQFIPNTNTYFAVQEAHVNIPNPASTGNPTYYLTNHLLNSFEPGDLRRKAWVDSTNYAGSLYYYPYKYKVQQTTATRHDRILHCAAPCGAIPDPGGGQGPGKQFRRCRRRSERHKATHQSGRLQRSSRCHRHTKRDHTRTGNRIVCRMGSPLVGPEALGDRRRHVGFDKRRRLPRHSTRLADTPGRSKRRS